MAAHDTRLILLDERDDVFVARTRIPAGARIETGGGPALVDRDIALAHKLARRDIAAGGTILKYGAPIGVATQAIAAGAHVHVHNLRSDYTPTYHLEDARGFPSPTHPGLARDGRHDVPKSATADFGAGEGGSAPSDAETDEGSRDLSGERGVALICEGTAPPHPAASPPPSPARGEGEHARRLPRPDTGMRGHPRADGRKGIRNHVAVAYLVECAHHVAREIALPFREDGVHVIGFPGCYPNAYAERMLERLCTHPNVGAALLVSLGCESFDKYALERAVRASGRPVMTLVIQGSGGTRASIREGRAWVEAAKAELDAAPTVAMTVSDLVVGTVCGGSDGTSGITGNPAAGRAFDRLIAGGAACIFEETGELIGCEQIMAARAITPELGAELEKSVAKAARYYATLGYGSFAAGNAEGGLSTIEEKSMGAYAKSGASPISGLLKPGDMPPRGGLYLLDMVPDGEVRFGFPNINDNAEIAELIACGAHCVLFVTGRGSVVGSAIAPVLKICANPETFRRMEDDMDVDAGRILEGRAGLDEIGREIFDRVAGVAAGGRSRSEELGHQEFVLTYKSFEPLGPACLPG